MTPEQEAAVLSRANDIVILAGPGSGKTTTIINRACRLVESGETPERSLAFVTFTNSAARVLRKRLEEAGIKHPGFVGTLHGMMLQLLRSVDSRWLVIDDEVSLEYIEAEAKILGYKGSAKDLLAARAGAVDNPSACRVIRAYRSRIRELRFLDTDSILIEGLAHLKQYGISWRRVFADEYQDSGTVDHQIYMEMLNWAGLTVVGDHDQCIYQFRGAKPQNLEELWDGGRFERHLLERNFRSDIAICSLANAIAKLIPNRVEKRTIPNSAQVGQVEYSFMTSQSEELRCVCQRVEHWIAGGTLPKNIAILSFTNAEREATTLALNASGIPVQAIVKTQRPKSWATLIKIAQLFASPENWGAASLFVRHMAKIRKEPHEEELRKLWLKQAAGKSVAEALDLPTWHSFLSMNANLARFCVTPLVFSMFADVIRLYQPESPMELVEALQADPEAEKVDGVSVITIHEAKGGEWDKVIVTGVDQFQHTEAEDLRLLFVAITRARFALTLTAASTRAQNFGPKKAIVTRSLGTPIMDTIRAVAVSSATLGQVPVET